MPRWYREVLTQEADPDLRSEIGHYLESRRPRSRKLDAGCVVEFVKKGHLTCGAVWHHVANGRMQLVIDRDAAQTWIRRTRLLDISTVKVTIRGRRQAASALELIDERRQGQVASLDMETLWALAAGSGEGWTTDFLTDLAFGDRRGGDSRAVLLRALYAGEWFARRGDRWVAHSDAAVDRRRQLARNRQRQSAELERLASWLRAVADGSTEQRLPEGHQRAIALLEEAALGTERGDRETRAATQLMARAHLHGAAAAADLLVRLGHWSVHENLEIHRGQVPIDFTPETLDAARHIRSSSRRHRWLAAADHCRRSWRRPLGWVATNDAGCERAFSIRRTLTGFKVSVFLASPALVFDKDSPLDQEAAVRGRSISPPDRRIPMLPAAIVEAITMELSQSCTLRSVEVDLRRVRPWLIGADEDPHARRPFSRLATLAEALRLSRLEFACMPDLRTPVVDATDGAPSFARPAHPLRETIDRELTHLACWAVAGWCRNREIPMVYRTQAGAEGSGESSRPLPETLPPRVCYEQLRRLLPRPSIQTEPAPEQVLGFTEYASLSHPCSRFEDLMVQRQLISAATGSGPVYGVAELEKGLADTATAREVADRVERSGQRYWTLLALETHAGDQLAGTVIDRAGLGYRVVLEESGFAAFVPAPGELWAQPGDRVVVRVAQVSASRNQLVLADPQRPAN